MKLEKKHRATGGFSMIDVIIVLAVTAVLASIGLLSLGKIRESAHETKMTNDVAILNSAAKAFQVRGGSFSQIETTESVLSALKSVQTNRRTPGFSGSLIDDRLVWIKQTTKEASSDNPRVTWNNASQRFEIVYQGDVGIGEFKLDDSSADESSEPKGVETTDGSPFLFAEKSGWIWDYDEESVKKDFSITEPTKVALTGGGQSNPIPVSLDVDYLGPIDVEEDNSNALAAPLIIPTSSSPGDSDEFTITIILRNPNPSDTSEISYSIDYGPWNRFDGTPIVISRGESIIAKTESNDTSQWADSPVETQPFEALAAIDITPVEPAPVNEEVISNEPEIVLNDPVLQLEESATLDFADEGVDFDGSGNHSFSNIGGTDATMGMSVSASPNINSFESSSASSTGETAAFWMAAGLGSAGASVILDLSENPVTKISLKIHFVEGATVDTNLTAIAQTSNGRTVALPEISRRADGGAKPTTQDLNFAEKDDPVVTIYLKWEQTSNEEGAYGLGLGAINFSFKTKSDPLLTSVLQ